MLYLHFVSISFIPPSSNPEKRGVRHPIGLPREQFSRKTPLPPSRFNSRPPLSVISLKTKFETQFPSAHYLDAGHLDHLDPLLRTHGLLETDEVITTTEKPGEGNMNFVLRVITSHRTLILKQSRPWVEKYPQIAAPVERLHAEAAYYQFAADEPNLQSMSPVLLGVDPTHLVIFSQDLGAGSDYTFIYEQGSLLDRAEIRSLFLYLAQLHHASQDTDPSTFPPNQALKVLNHEHIFNYPFSAHQGFDLESIQPGLQSLANPIIQDEVLRDRLTHLGNIYLGSGPVLIHGDFYPGSWLRTTHGLKIIDPEFAHFGQAEFDVGVLIAHLLLARTSSERIKLGLLAYQQYDSLDESLAFEFAGAEILRRLLGLAQLPVDLSLAEKEELISLAKTFVIDPASAARF